MTNAKVIINRLEEFGILKQGHTGRSLIEHLEGTYNILKKWNCCEDLCLAGLCHSIYGTESYKKQTVPLESRTSVKKLIGKDAEELAYLFGAHKKEYFWELLGENKNFNIHDRFSDQIINIGKDQVSSLVTLTLANWLEQRPMVDKKYHQIRKNEFLHSKQFLPAIAYSEFKQAYNIN